MIVLIDDYDSFSYNLFQMIGEITPEIRVIRNDEYTVQEIGEMHPSHIILSPGPGRPADAGVCEAVAEAFQDSVPILGVCLGHQAICESFGAEVSYAKKLMHGKKSVVSLDTSCRLFQGLEEQIEVARYHSLAVMAESIPEILKVIAHTEDGEIMAVKHSQHEVYGVQFHPESILTPQGSKILRNFIEIKKKEN